MATRQLASMVSPLRLRSSDPAGQAAVLLRRGDAHIVAVDADRVGHRRAVDVAPLLDPLVPVVGEVERIVAGDVVEPRRGRHQRRDGDGDGEGADAGVLLPAILLAGRAVAGDRGDRRAAPSRSRPAVPVRRSRGASPRAGSERRSRRAGCRSRTAGRSGSSSATSGRPAAATAIRWASMRRASSTSLTASSAKAPITRVARPDQVVAAERIGVVAPRRAHARHHRAGEHPVLVHLENGRRHQRLVEKAGILRGQRQASRPSAPSRR